MRYTLIQPLLFLISVLSTVVNAVPVSVGNHSPLTSSLRRRLLQSSSSPPPDPYTLYFFTCEPIANSIAQGKSLEEADQPAHDGQPRVLSMNPNQGNIAHVAPRNCNGHKFAVVEFKLNQDSGLEITDMRNTNTGAHVSPGSGSSSQTADVILTRVTGHPSVLIAELMTAQAAHPPALEYVRHAVAATAVDAFNELTSAQAAVGEHRMTID
ncbi:hypothetical protein F5880DRAFT_1618014 [Lentinula raphanica]|nr:hypothetical protein EV360DRAFT_83632 [Lentinula raphanica]KAJ3817736.1 hypothetical protein F5880DRAFT_1618014 [Lentinula raphanica]